MADLVLNGTTYAYPNPGTEAGAWGQDATDWAQDVTDTLNSLSTTGSINQTKVNIDITATDKEIPSLLFNNSITESAKVAYRISRSTDGIGAEILSESGTLDLVYDAASSDWLMTRTITSGVYSRVILNVSTTGQISYTSATLTGSNYVGYIKFKTIVTVGVL